MDLCSLLSEIKINIGLFHMDNFQSITNPRGGFNLFKVHKEGFSLSACTSTTRFKYEGIRVYDPFPKEKSGGGCNNGAAWSLSVGFLGYCLNSRAMEGGKPSTIL